MCIADLVYLFRDQLVLIDVNGHFFLYFRREGDDGYHYPPFYDGVYDAGGREHAPHLRCTSSHR